MNESIPSTLVKIVSIPEAEAKLIFQIMTKRVQTAEQEEQAPRIETRESYSKSQSRGNSPACIVSTNKKNKEKLRLL